MRSVHLGLFVTAAVLLGGCAGGPSSKDLARLQSQVGLLDERVTQLERAGGANDESLSAAPSSQPPAAPELAPASPPSMKPSTREIQQALKNAGFYQDPIDGKMGPSTRNAVQEFQRVHGLVDDGVVGKKTWAKLRAFADLSGQHGEANAAEVLK